MQVYSVRPFTVVRAVDIIVKKRDGGSLSRQEIAFFIAGVTDGTVADYQASAFLMAVVLVTGVGFGRVYRGPHSPSDVFAGALLGIACLVVAAIAVRVASSRASRSRRPAEPGS